jgi:polysaccharide biosynthesis/export protein
MESWVIRTTKLVTVLLFCGSLMSRFTASAEVAGESPSAAPAAVPAQSQRAPNDPQPGESYVIGNDDVLSISVWKEPDLTRPVPVRSDGKISLPLVGDVQAAGRTPGQLEQDIAAKLQGFITNPQVTVIVQEIKSQNFNVLGQVTKPGSYPLAAGTTVVDAIATAGGFRDFAKKKSIYVLRENPGGGQSRIIFNYHEFLKGKNITQNIKLKPHDTVVVP